MNVFKYGEGHLLQAPFYVEDGELKMGNGIYTPAIVTEVGADGFHAYRVRVVGFKGLVGILEKRALPHWLTWTELVRDDVGSVWDVVRAEWCRNSLDIWVHLEQSVRGIQVMDRVRLGSMKDWTIMG
jgi:hypothetical protein